MADGVAADFHAGAFKLTGKPTIILGNDGGLNVSYDAGETWTRQVPPHRVADALRHPYVYLPKHLLPKKHLLLKKLRQKQ